VALNLVELTLDCFDGTGQPVTQGTAFLVASSVLTDITDHQIVWQYPIPVALEPPEGASDSWLPTVSIYATDNANLSPSGWVWTISFQAPGAPVPFSFELPYSDGASQYLSAQTPVYIAPAVSSWFTVPSVAEGVSSPGAGWVPVPAGSAAAAAWSPLQAASGAASSPLTPFYAGLSNRQFSRCNVVCLGDSITEGQHAVGPPDTGFDNRWLARLRDRLRLAFPISGSGQQPGVPPAAGVLLAYSSYAPSSATSYTVSSTTMAAFSSANLNTGAFTAPASGAVLVSVSCVMLPGTAGATYSVALAQHGTTTPVSNVVTAEDDSVITGSYPSRTFTFLVTGLTSGTSYTLDLIGAVASGQSMSVVAYGSKSVTPTGTHGGPVITETSAVALPGTGGRGFISCTSTGETSFTWPATKAGSPAKLLCGPKSGDSTAASAYQLNATGQSFTFSLCGDSADLMWLQVAFGGTFSWAVDGGTATNISTNGSGTVDGKITHISLGTPGLHTLVIAWVSGNVGFDGVIEYNGDYASGVQVHDAGHFGWTTSSWLTPLSSGASGSAAAIAALSPDLVIITLGVNDQYDGITPATYGSNLRQIISYLKAELTAPYPSFVLSMLPPRSGQSGYSYPWYLYVEQAWSIALSDTSGPSSQSIVSVMDFTQGPVMPGADVDAYGFWQSGDPVHPSNLGHQMIADQLAEFLTAGGF
jgi:lysophospholipase L1-like esterase